MKKFTFEKNFEFLKSIYLKEQKTTAILKSVFSRTEAER